MADTTRFVAAAPTGYIRAAAAGKAIKQLLWGDHVRLTGPAVDGWVPVDCRRTRGFMKEADLSKERLLEVMFVDIGQGDGALVVTPDDQHLVVDAGEDDNMYRFMRWRYGGLDRPFTFAAAVISHPDQDHYKGFGPIFDEPNVRFEALYHNGLIERTGPDTLGPRIQKSVEVTRTHAQLTALVGDPAKRAGKRYPTMLHEALPKLATTQALSAADAHVPGFAPGDKPSGLVIQVLGPVHDQIAGEPRLPWLGDLGKTKNGHSVVLRMVYGGVSILVGGDLNIPAEHRLLRHYTGHAMPPAEADRSAVVEGARRVFRSDIAKACHHGSADFTDLFLQSVDPLVTVISSGDAEPHAHPRADALGAVGRWGRGVRPLVFSTELARSAPETIKRPFAFRRDLQAAQDALHAALPGPVRDKAKAAVDKLMSQIERSVAVYGTITLRTDGKRVLMAQKVEAPTRVTGQWDVYLLEPDAAGVLRYRSKH